jgi:hypothetical protein
MLFTKNFSEELQELALEWGRKNKLNLEGTELAKRFLQQVLEKSTVSFTTPGGAHSQHNGYYLVGTTEKLITVLLEVGHDRGTYWEIHFTSGGIMVKLGQLISPQL